LPVTENVTLRVKLDYGICEKLCILAKANVELVLTGGPGYYETALTNAEAQVPKQVGLAEGHTLSIRDVRREVGSTQSRVVIDVAAPDTSSVDLFVEGPTPNWALPLPDPISAQPGLRRFAFDLIGFPAGTEPVGAVLKFTAVSGEEAIEVSTDLK